MQNDAKIDPKTFSAQFKWRSELLVALQDVTLSNPKHTETLLQKALASLRAHRRMLSDSAQKMMEIMERLLTATSQLATWVRLLTDASDTAQTPLNAAKLNAATVLELLPPIQNREFSAAARATALEIQNLCEPAALKEVATQLERIPIPVFVLTESASGRYREQKPVEDSGPSGPFVIKVMFQLQGRPWATPQTVLAQTSYDVAASITIPEWPKDATTLKIDYLSTASPELYRIEPIEIARPTDSVTEFNRLHHAVFPFAQQILAEPLNVKVRATYRSARSAIVVPATIVGYHELRVTISDPARTPALSRYPAIDTRIVEIIGEVRAQIGEVGNDHLADFIDSLSAITNFMGINLQQGLYKGSAEISESDFHQRLLYHMRTFLGQEVEKGPERGAGITDIVFRSITTELKVEKRIADRRKLIDKYSPQAAQYAASTGAKLGILCILDLRQKRHPPANPQSNISFELPTQHGFETSPPSHPVGIVVVIIDGNLKSPSQYSK